MKAVFGRMIKRKERQGRNLGVKSLAYTSKTDFGIQRLQKCIGSVSFPGNDLFRWGQDSRYTVFLC
jgi:hypothetical protein